EGRNPRRRLKALRERTPLTYHRRRRRTARPQILIRHGLRRDLPGLDKRDAARQKRREASSHLRGCELLDERADDGQPQEEAVERESARRRARPEVERRAAYDDGGRDPVEVSGGEMRDAYDD